MTRYRAALIGLGKSVGNPLGALRALSDRVTLTAAVDVDADRARAVCAAHGIPAWYTDVDAMLRREQPDLVIIATPPASHVALCTAALEAGAWAWCEKPLCASLAAFDALSAVEARTGRFISTVFQWRFGSAAKHLRALIAAGALGKPLVATCHTLWYRPQAYYQDDWRGRWRTEFGGPTMTLGIHLTDLLLWLLGGWEEVSAMTGTLDRAIEVEDVSMALVRFTSGALGTISSSVLSPRQHSYLRLDFQRATVEVNALYRYTSADWTITTPDGALDDGALAAWRRLTDDVPGDHAAQLRDLLDAMDAGVRPPVSGEEARRILEFNAALYKSAFTGARVRRGEITPSDPFYHAMHGGAP
jgi:predicted dehydrogenase